MPDTFEVETRGGFRLVEFDPDVFRFKDVRILVDGKSVAEMPFPKSASPYQRASFDMDGFAMVGIAYLSTGPLPAEAGGVQYDLFANGRSLSDGSSLVDAVDRAAAPGNAYPGAFRVIDAILQITPASAARGLGIGLGRGAGDMGWAPTLLLIATTLGALGVATAVAAQVWTRIRAEESWSVRRRAMAGGAAVIAVYLAVFGCILLLILAVRPSP